MRRGAWGKLLDVLNARLDRLTYDRRRRRARERLRANGPPKKILIVCSGNICRSPYAEARLRRALAEGGLTDIQVESAGFFGPDRPAHEPGMAVAAKRGVSLDSHRSRLIPSDSKRRYELVLVLTRHHRDELDRFGIPPERVMFLGDFDNADYRREIPDPYGRPEAVLEEVFDRIERSIVGLCRSLRE
ncbi:MAG: arsenate reductase/protein-tyrosine-phosphatase family protein [Gemmatimonadales bacterium]